LSVPGGSACSRVRETRDWVVRCLLNPFNERTTWAYDALSRASTLSLANGAVTTYAYDAAGRLTLLRNAKSDGTTISSFEYGNDSVGNRTGVVEANGDRVTWSYDALYQLTRERRDGAFGSIHLRSMGTFGLTSWPALSPVRYMLSPCQSTSSSPCRSVPAASVSR